MKRETLTRAKPHTAPPRCPKCTAFMKMIRKPESAGDRGEYQCTRCAAPAESEDQSATAAAFDSP